MAVPLAPVTRVVSSRPSEWRDGRLTARVPGVSVGSAAIVAALLGVALLAAACGVGAPVRGSGHPSTNREGSTPTTSTTTTAVTTPPPTTTTTIPPLASPAALTPFAPGGPANEGTWTAAGRAVGATVAVYETQLVPPGGSQAAGIAWMDTKLLSAQLYSGSKSPGGGPYQFTAPILPAQAASLVAAFNGGFLMNSAGGGYYTEGRVVVPLVTGAASLVIFTDGSVTVGAWGTDVSMAPNVVAVRQNLVPLVTGGQPTAQAAGPDWQAWGATCGATSCASSVQGIENQWRSGAGVTADGALVYAAGPGLTPLQLAQLLARAGVARGMELDINPNWPVFVTYAPSPPTAPAAPANGSDLQPSSAQGPATFFNPAWARDFVTMSARATPATS